MRLFIFFFFLFRSETLFITPKLYPTSNRWQQRAMVRAFCTTVKRIILGRNKTGTPQKISSVPVLFRSRIFLSQNSPVYGINFTIRRGDTAHLQTQRVPAHISSFKFLKVFYPPKQCAQNPLQCKSPHICKIWSSEHSHRFPPFSLLIFFLLNVHVHISMLPCLQEIPLSS